MKQIYGMIIYSKKQNESHYLIKLLTNEDVIYYCYTSTMRKNTFCYQGLLVEGMLIEIGGFIYLKIFKCEDYFLHFKWQNAKQLKAALSMLQSLYKIPLNCKISALYLNLEIALKLCLSNCDNSLKNWNEYMKNIEY